MKDTGIAKAASARNKAQLILERKVQNHAEFFRERKRQEAANREKSARLKALRLAKEAADKEAAAAETSVKMRKSKNKKGEPTSLQAHSSSE